MLIEKIKHKALEASGSYIEGNSHLDNGELKESIRSIKAAIMKLSVIEERLSIAAGKIKITLSADIAVDQQILHERIHQISDNKEAQNRINVLVEQNNLLTKKLEEIVEKKEVSSFQKIIGEIERNNEKIANNSIFDAPAVKESILKNKETYFYNNSISRKLFYTLEANPPQTKIEYIEKSSYNIIDVYVKINWRPDVDLITDILKNDLEIVDTNRIYNNQEIPISIAFAAKDNHSSRKLMRVLQSKPAYATFSTNNKNKHYYAWSACGTSRFRSSEKQHLCFYNIDLKEKFRVDRLEAESRGIRTKFRLTYKNNF